MKTKSLHVSIDPKIVDKVDELKLKYNRSRPEMVERMLTVAIAMEQDGKIVL